MFHIVMETDNDAFTAAANLETARILREIARDLEDGILKGKTRDYNGNSCGTWELNDE